MNAAVSSMVVIVRNARMFSFTPAASCTAAEETNDELSALFVRSKAGNKLKIFKCYKTIDFRKFNIRIRFRDYIRFNS